MNFLDIQDDGELFVMHGGKRITILFSRESIGCHAVAIEVTPFKSILARFKRNEENN